ATEPHRNAHRCDELAGHLLLAQRTSQGTRIWPGHTRRGEKNQGEETKKTQRSTGLLCFDRRPVRRPVFGAGVFPSSGFEAVVLSSGFGRFRINLWDIEQSLPS